MAKPKQANQPMTNIMKYRLNRVVALCLAVLLLYVGVRLFDASVVQADFYQEFAAKQQMSTQVINANRGSIYSTNMSILAQSATVWTVVLAPSIVKNDKVYVEIDSIPEGQKDTLAASLAGILESDQAKIRKRLDKDQRFVLIKSSLTDAQVKKIQDFSKQNSCVMLAKEAVAKGLSDILELDYDKVLEQAYRDNQYEVIKKKVEKTVADEVRKMISENGFTFISLIEDTKRYYPNNELASNVLGFTGTDNQGLYGIELEYDSILQGTNGKIVSATDGLGNTIPTSFEQKYDAVDGNSVVLTIDENIQRFAEKQVDEIVKLHDPSGGALAIVMDVDTGAILAMANSNNYDPNNPSTIFSDQLKETLAQAESENKSEDEISKVKSQLRSEQWSNKAIGWLYEPGSTFKVVTASAALETGAATLDSTYNCTGVLNVAGTNIHCNKRTGHGHLDFKGAIVNSCNPAFMTMGAKMGAHNFYDFFQKFGLTEGTGIDLPGEAQKSIYYTEDKLGPVELASASFGQTSAITPIQLITAVSSAVNGGYLMQPYLLKEVLDQDGNVLETTSPTVKRQVISEETSAKMRDCLEAMVENNKVAYVKGYRIGGKSGTSQKANQSKEHVSSFVGFAPADDPKIAVLVVADNPTVGSYYGSAVCGPAMSSIIKDTLSYMGISPQYSDEDLENMEESVPNLIGQTVTDAKNTLAKKSLNIKKIGDGDKVVDQMPRSGSIADGGTVIVYTETDSVAQKATVPNVIGLTPSEANQKLINAGLNVSLEGGSTTGSNVKVISQSVEEGKEVPVGTIVSIQYAVEVVD